MSKIIIASGPVIVENNNALLDKDEKDSFWKFCGGKPKDGEDLKQTAVRRAKEELGIDIQITDPVPFLMYLKRDGKDILLVHWLAIRTGEIKKGEGIVESDFFKTDSLPEDVGPNIKPALKHFGFIE